MNLAADIVVLSANESPLYLDFWPFVAFVYRAMFPNVYVKLAFLTERREDDPFVAQIREHGDVVLIRPVRDIPQPAQAKMARYFVAAQQGDAVCYLDDIEWIPIDDNWHASKAAQRKPGTLLLVGQEVYNAEMTGQAPASQMTAEGHVFRALFNPDDLPWPEWLRSLGGREGKHRDIYSRVQHEGIGCTTDDKRLGNHLFSDEALVVALRNERPVPVTVAHRGYEPGVDTIDRCAWPALDIAKLNRGGYLGAQTARPYNVPEHKAGNDAIFAYIGRRYGATVPAALQKVPRVDPDMSFDESMSRGAFEWICANVSTSEAILEVGSGHVSTNYLSRYYEVRTVTHDASILNQYPAFYLYAPDAGNGYDSAWLDTAFSCYNTYRPHGLLLVNDADRAMSCMDRLRVDKPVVIADGTHPIVDVLASQSKRLARGIGPFAVI